MTTTPAPAYLAQSVTDAIRYADAHGIEIPLDLRLRAVQAGALKSQDDLTVINAGYHDAITDALTGYFENDGSITAPRNAFKQAMVEAFGAAWDLGYSDAGSQPDSDALAWFNARVQAEFGYIDMLFVQAKELRNDPDFDWFAWVTERADGYVATLREIYNAAFLRGSKDIMVTFDGDDGAESCDDCQKYKGQRHRISWFVKRNAIPPYGTGLECHRGGRCQHYLRDDNGRQVTV